MLVIAALIAALFTFPADVRPDAIVGATDVAEREVHGRAIVARGVEAQGGSEAWGRIAQLEAELTDTWDVTAFRLAMPMSEDEVALHASWPLHDHGANAVYTVQSGAQQGARLGLSEGEGWSEGPRASSDVFLRFFGATMKFLPTLAFRAPDAEVLRYVDTVERDGRAFDRVLMTWGDPEAPSADMDQYVLYYAQDTGRLEAAECTVRDFGPMMTGFIAYSGEVEAGGIRLPAAYDMGLGGLGGPVVHRVRIHALSTADALASAAISD